MRELLKSANCRKTKTLEHPKNPNLLRASNKTGRSGSTNQGRGSFCGKGCANGGSLSTVFARASNAAFSLRSLRSFQGARTLALNSGLFFVLTVGFSSNSQAQNILRVQDGKAFAEWPAEAPPTGEEFFALTVDGKRTAIGKVTVSKGRRAILELVKGQWTAGQTLESKPTSEKSVAQKTTAEKTRFGGGLLLGYHMDTLNMTAKGGGLEVPVSLKGSTFAVKGFFDFNLGPNFILRGLSGLDGFNVTGTTTSDNSPVCLDTTTCSINFSYLSLEGQALLRMLPNGGFRPFLLAGYSFFMAMSNGKTTVTNFDAGVKTNSAFVVGAGGEIRVSPTFFIPLGVNYRMYQVSSGISANSLAISLGTQFLF